MVDEKKKDIDTANESELEAMADALLGEKPKRKRVSKAKKAEAVPAEVSESNNQYEIKDNVDPRLWTKPFFYPNSESIL